MEQRQATEEGIPVADLLQAVEGFRCHRSGFLTPAKLQAWLVDSGFAEAAEDGRVTPTAEARGLVEAMRWD